MNEANFTVDDVYEVNAAGVITDYDRKVLLRLYQPVIGCGAAALFLTLNAEFDGERTITTTVKPLRRLLSLMKIDLEEMRTYRRRLEGVGLLRTFVKEAPTGRKIVFQLFAPLLPREFFNHGVLGVLFTEVMGREETERTRVYFASYGKIGAGYEEVSAGFKDVFGTINVNETPSGKQPDALSRRPGIPRLEFDFSLLEEGLEEYRLSKKTLTPEVKNEILLAANAYRIDAYDMRAILLASLDADGKINLRRLERKCREQGNISVKKEKPRLVLSGDKALDEKIRLMSELTPIEYLALKYDGRPPLPADASLVTNLQQSTGLTSGVINVLLDYCLIKNNNRLIPNYLERIAGSLMRAKIADPLAAMNFLKETPTAAKIKRKEEKPSSARETVQEIDEDDIEDDLAFIRDLKAGDK